MRYGLPISERARAFAAFNKLFNYVFFCNFSLLALVHSAVDYFSSISSRSLVPGLGNVCLALRYV